MTDQAEELQTALLQSEAVVTASEARAAGRAVAKDDSL